MRPKFLVHLGEGQIVVLRYEYQISEVWVGCKNKPRIFPTAVDISSLFSKEKPRYQFIKFRQKVWIKVGKVDEDKWQGTLERIGRSYIIEEIRALGNIMR